MTWRGGATDIWRRGPAETWGGPGETWRGSY